jgi:DNA-binding transcriptional MocR family regulator
MTATKAIPPHTRREGIINFGVGHPSDDLLPVDLLRAAADEYLREAPAGDLNYGTRQGAPVFRETLAAFLGSSYGAPASAEGLFVTGGISQALDTVCLQLTDPGDTIFIEEPTYSRMFRIFADHGLNVVGIPVDEDGLVIDVLVSELARTRPKFLYTIPSFHNPGGQTLSANRREQLLELSREFDFLIVADEVYQLLFYDDPPPAAFGCRADSERVLSLGSFSKILAPGLRLGWIQTSPPLIERLLENGAVCSGGSLNHFTSLVVRPIIESGRLASHIERLRDAYRLRVETMDTALHEHLEGVASWRRPGGGYFFWLELAGDIDTTELNRRADRHDVLFDPGEHSSCCGGLTNFLRLCFAYYGDAEIREGVARLAAALRG